MSTISIIHHHSYSPPRYHHRVSSLPPITLSIWYTLYLFHSRISHLVITGESKSHKAGSLSNLSRVRFTYLVTMVEHAQIDAQSLTEISHGSAFRTGEHFDGASINKRQQINLLTSSLRHPLVDSPSAAIQNQPQNNFTYSFVQDVLPPSLNLPRSPANPGVTHLSSEPFSIQNVPHHPTTLESNLLPSHLAHHGPVTVPQTDSRQRPRTRLLPKLRNSRLLAAQYGIPTKLPKPPHPNINSSYNVNRINQSTKNSKTLPDLKSSAIIPSTSTSTNLNISISDIHSLMTEYINMLANKPGEASGAVFPEAPKDSSSKTKTSEPSSEDAAESIRALFGKSSHDDSISLAHVLLEGGANDLTSSAWDEYLTSPFEFGLDNTSATNSPFDTPIDTLLATPALGFAGSNDFFTSPIVADDVLPDFDSSLADMPLFAGLSTVSVDSLTTTNKQSQEIEEPDLTGLYTIPMTPEIASLDSSSDSSMSMSPSLQEPVPVEAIASSSASSSKKGGARTARKTPTGTRKNLTPEALVPIDAPTQPRTYLAPSATSRKEVPAIFARKRSRKTAFEADGEDDDGPSRPATPIPGTPIMSGPTFLASLGLPPDASEAEQIAAKRRQNTLAARRSRKRKLEYQKHLEDSIESITKDRDSWKERALALRRQIIQMGYPEPFGEE